jgi:hypothetical protein
MLSSQWTCDTSQLSKEYFPSFFPFLQLHTKERGKEERRLIISDGHAPANGGGMEILSLSHHLLGLFGWGI